MLFPWVFAFDHKEYVKRIWADIVWDATLNWYIAYEKKLHMTDKAKDDIFMIYC